METLLMWFSRIYLNVTTCCNSCQFRQVVTAERALRDRMSLLANKLILAQQDAPLEPICL